MNSFISIAKKSLIPFVFLFISATHTFSQGTTCAGATSITTNGACTSAATISDATINGNATVCGATVTREGWYIFTTTGTTATIVATANNRNVAIELLSACGGTVVGCDNTTNVNGTDTETLTVSGLTNATNYIIRIVNVGSNDLNFTSLCVTGPAAPGPSNDDPTGATPVSPAASCSYTTFTNAGATSTSCGTIPAPGCSSYTGGDVWFSFTVPATGAVIIDSQTGVMTDGGMAVYSGAACGAMTLINCDDDGSANGAMPTLTITGQSAGSTLYIRFWEYGNNNNGTFGLCLTTYTPPVAPANDNPCTATAAAVNAVNSCTAQTGGTLVGATSSTVGLGSCFGTADDDVWYSFVANNSTQLISLNNIAGSTSDLYFSIHPGTCGAIGAALLCSDPESNTVTGLTVGTTYYVRVYSYTSTTGQTSTFSLCISPPPTPPANDNPCSATAAAVNAVYSCTAQTGGTLVGATSSTVGLGSCFGTADDDVWYSFVANNATQLISLNNIAGSTSDLYFSIHPGTCGAIGAALLCSDPESNTVTGLTVGTTYYVRIYSYTSTTGQTSTFSLCITPPPTPPANDNPCTATAAAVNAVFSCTTQTGGTLAGATSSTVGLGACFGTADDDVWYSFVANNSTQLISLNNVAGSTTDLYHSVYSGSCGAPGAALICSDPNSSTVTGLTVGNTYYVRVYSYTSTTGQTTTFSLCINPPPLPPSNDNPCGATAAPVNSAAGTCTVQTAGTIAGATASGVALGACFGTADDDVWYSFVANGTSMNINLNNVNGSTTDLYHSVYAGTCGSLGAALICSDPNSSTISGLTIGNTYYVRIYSYTSTTGQTTTFNLCINPTPPPPTNVTCGQMQPICSGSPIVFQAQSGGGSAAPGPDYGCLSTTPNPTWFYLEIATPGSMAIDLTAGSDVDFAMWGPYSNLTDAQADCSSYPTPIDCSYSGSNVELMDIASVNVGEVYAVLVTNYANVVQSITLNQASGASATTNCAIVTLPVGLIYFDAKPNGNAIDITWETESEVNNDYFVIEKSSDAVNWETLIQKDGQGTSTVRTKYKHTDNKPYSDISYYRLKQVDFDLSHNYSNIVSVDLSKNNELISNVHPNPTNDVVYYDLTTTSKGDITVEVINYAGEVIYNNNQAVEFGKNSLNLSLQEFENGVYLIKIKIENSGKSLIQKIIKH